MRHLRFIMLTLLVLLCVNGALLAQAPTADLTQSGVSVSPSASLHPVRFSGMAPRDTYVRLYIQGPTDTNVVFRGAPAMNYDFSWSWDDVLVGDGVWKINVDIKSATGVWLGHLEQFTLTTTPGTQIATLDLQQGVGGYNGTTDCYISDWMDGDEYKAFGTLEPGTLRLRKVDRKAILIKFALGRLPANSGVQHASMGLYAFFNTNPSGPTIMTYRLKRAWNESTATWLSPRAGQLWAEPEAMGAGIDRQANPFFTHKGDIVPGWTIFDVSSAVRAWNTGAYNAGLLLRSWDPYWASSAENSFYSSEWKQAALRPRMTIYYTVPAGG